MRYIVTINDKNYEVEVEREQASIVKTTQSAAPSVQKLVHVEDCNMASAAPLEPVVHAGTDAGSPVKAPMPGSIVSVSVSQGVPVKKGDVLFILEAMKMEMEVTSPEDGVVTRIFVAKGASVSTGDILLTLQ